MKPFWCNYHGHTHFCDGVQKPFDYLAEAGNQQVISYGFSSHAPLPFPHDCTWVMKTDDLEHYLAEINEAALKQNAVQVYRSLEIDYVPGRFGPGHAIIKNANLDYTLSSVHFVEQFNDGKLWEIDGAHSLFLEGLEHIFKNDIKAAVSRYYEITRELLQKDPPDILGHLDKIKMQNYKNDKIRTPFYHEEENWYQQEIEKTLKAVKSAGTIVEVNTRGIYQQKTTETYPGTMTLRKMLEMQIPVTICSDCHHPRQITSMFSETARMLLQIGFTKVKILWDGNWIDARLTPAGYLI